MAFRNQEGYSDPAAGRAVANTMKEYRARRREIWKRQHEIRSRPKIYVVSRYAGNIKKNVAAAIRCCQYVIREGGIPVASHLLYPCMLRDHVDEERELGTGFGMALLAVCEEVWIFRDELGLSAGMQAEEQEARRLGKPIRYFDLEVIP